MSEGAGQPTGVEVVKAMFVAGVAAVGSVALVGVVQVPRESAASLVILILLFGLPLAMLHVLIFALPLYLALRERWRLLWWNAALAGFLISAVPITLLSLPALIAPPTPEDLVIYDGPPLWLRFLLRTIEAGVPGVVGGLAFWTRLR